MVDFLTIILLIFGVLQIILFFKIWGMTNDVKRLTNKFCNNDVNAEKVIFNTLIEEETLNKSTIENLIDKDAEITVGDRVIRSKDGKEMLVDRIVCGKYGCVDPNTNTFIAGYERNEIGKKKP